MFLHLDIEHLLGNMLFLWVFGLVVEGKIGWQRFLACYMAIGLLQSIGEQSLQILLGGVGGSYGASSAIFGIMAMAAVWAPKNNITVFYWLFFYFGSFEVTILIVALLYIGMDVLFAGIEGFNSSSWLHLGGAMLGAPLAILMLKRGVVDCEKWDIFHVMRDEAGGTKIDPKVDAAELAELKQNRDAKLLDEAKEQIQLYLSVGNIAAAILLHKKMQRVGDGLQLKRSVLLKFVTALHQEKRWQDSCPFMAELIKQFPQESHSMQVKLAQICVLELQKPRKALELLQQLPLQELPAKTLSLVKKIAQRAQQMQAEGIIELDNDDWN